MGSDCAPDNISGFDWLVHWYVWLYDLSVLACEESVGPYSSRPLRYFLWSFHRGYCSKFLHRSVVAATAAASAVETPDDKNKEGRSYCKLLAWLYVSFSHI